jgi:nucleotide-binding universal stress UspA family protein
MRILIGVDGSSQALAGARWVAGLPLTARDEVIVAAIVQQPVPVVTWGYIHSPATSASLEAAWEEARQAARQTTDTGAEALGDLVCQLRTVVRDGHPVDGLTRLAEEIAADLVVVGPHGRGRLDTILLGSVSQGLLHRMPAAVLVAREPVSRPALVLLATDGSSHSLAAGSYLARIPLPTDARVEVLAVCGDTPGLTASEERNRASEAIDISIEALAAGDRDATPLIRHGDPKREILAATRELGADLLVTGSRGLGGFAGLVLGSVSRALAKAAPCSVLVVPEGPGADA